MSANRVADRRVVRASDAAAAGERRKEPIADAARTRSAAVKQRWPASHVSAGTERRRRPQRQPPKHAARGGGLRSPAPSDGASPQTSLPGARKRRPTRHAMLAVR